MTPKERPLLCSEPVVMSMLRREKTQTRRPIHRLAGFGPVTEFGPSDTPGYDWTFRDREGRLPDVRHARLLDLCPLGAAGDRLWARETHAIVPRCAYARSTGVHLTSKPDDPYMAAVYRAGWTRCAPGTWRPSIHMPRWASRLTLQIVTIWVERIQDIRPEDALAEGIERVPQLGILRAAGWRDYSGKSPGFFDPVASYRSLWESLYGPDSWNDNPWVWAIAFSYL